MYIDGGMDKENVVHIHSIIKKNEPKSFCTTKETIHKMTRPPMGWKEIFVDDMTNKGLISKIKTKRV